MRSTAEEDNLALKNFLDEQGRLTSWPAKYRLKLAACPYLAGLFPRCRVFSEREANDLLRLRHSFADPATLRRFLVDLNYLGRSRDGSRYWRADPLED